MAENDPVFEAPSGPIIITGAVGRVAHGVIPLLSKELDLRLFDLHDGTLDGRPVAGVDLLDREATLAAFKGARSLVHFAIAGYSKGVNELDSPKMVDYHRRMLDVNIKGSYHVFEAARLNGIPQVVYISSLTIMLGHDVKSDLKETLPPKPSGIYACTKLFGEQLAEFYSRVHGIRAILLRLGTPADREKFQKILRHPGSRALLTGYGDMARAIECALRADHVRMGTYNVVSASSEPVDCGNGRAIGFEPRESFDP